MRTGEPPTTSPSDKSICTTTRCSRSRCADDHIKPRLLGHWGTTPGLTSLCPLNRLIKKYDLEHDLHLRPRAWRAGHGREYWLEGTYSEFYPNIAPRRRRDEAAVHAILVSRRDPEPRRARDTRIDKRRRRTWLFARTPTERFLTTGSDRLLCLGDGEAETGALAASWHSNKFFDPACDGAVLPILHLNGYKIAGPASLLAISHEELDALLRGYGYTPYFVEGDEPEAMHQAMARNTGHGRRRNPAYQERARLERFPKRPLWPMIVLRTPQRLDWPEGVDGGRSRATCARIRCRWPKCTTTPNTSNPRRLDEELPARGIVRRARPLRPELAALAPRGDRANGRQSAHQRRPAAARSQLPNFRDYAVEVTAPGATTAESTRVIGRVPARCHET